MLLFVGLMLLLISCSREEKQPVTKELTVSDLGEIKPLVHNSIPWDEDYPFSTTCTFPLKCPPCFSHPVQFLNRDLLNSPDKMSNYVTSSKKGS